MRLFALAAFAALAAAPASADNLAGKKVLYVNAYHQGYAWSDGIEAAIVARLQASGVQTKTVRLDSKLHPESVAAKVKEAKAILDAEKPDAVIVSDDNPVKFFVTPYLKGAATPVVFCGVNWDGSAHGLPYPNTTGMYEVSLTRQMVGALSKVAKGSRVGFLASDNETAHADAAGIKKYCDQPALADRYVKDLAGWKAEFVKMQTSVDILLVRIDGLKGWDNAAMASWVEENIRIPVGADQEEVAPFALATFAKLPSEQGEWAADAAMAIMRGAKPGDIPAARNHKSKIIVNQRLAKKLGVALDPTVFAGAVSVN